MKSLAWLLLPLFLFISCENGDVKIPDAEEIPLKANMKQRVKQDNEFAWELFKNLNTTAEEDNVFISPISVSIALGMTKNGADGETKTEMEAALKLSDMTDMEINEYYKIMQNSLVSIDPSTKLNIANSIWYREGLLVKSDFMNTNKSYFNAEVQALDFTHPNALKTINNWCSDKTKGLIKEPLDNISASAMMYLINAIYFKGIWCSQFEKKQTATRDFFSYAKESNKVDMMHQTQSFYYYEDEHAQYLDMPYGNKAFSMTVILPNAKQSTDDFIVNIEKDYWDQVVERLSPQEVQVYFPKFKVKGNYELKETLQQMGMVQAFEANADFSKMSDLDLLISRIIHSSYCDVNEEGTEAAAITIVEMMESAMPINQVFNANRPFIFIIRERSTGIMLFMGKMNSIEKYN